MVALLFSAALAYSPQARAQSSDVAALKKEVAELKVMLKDMQKDLRAIKDLASGKQPPLENVQISIDGAHVQGDTNAKVMLVEFSDFQCPYCGRHAGETYSKIVDEYVKTGKVRYALRNFPIESIHPLAFKAGEAAECANDQGKYWEMHDRLFKNQTQLQANELMGHAVALGLDQAQFKQCMDAGKHSAKIKKDVADGGQLGVKGTPTFFFGYVDDQDPKKLKAVTILRGAQPFNAFTGILNNLLEPKEIEN